MVSVYYFCPDVASPSGGVHTLYRHVAILRRGGISAWVLHTQMFFELTWASVPDVDVRYINNGVRPQPGDHLVIPEGCIGLMREYAGTPVTRTIFAQNWSYVWSGLRVGEDYRQWGIADVMTVSRYIQSMLQATMRLDATVIHPGIDPERFHPAEKKLRQIAFMPRKNPEDAHRIRQMFALLSPSNVNIKFVAIDGLSHDRVAAVLAESEFFLATGYPEGCPLPPLEAMCSGCVVVGFDGMGMREYVEHGVNGFVVPDGDCLQAATVLDAVVNCKGGWDAAALAARARDVVCSAYTLECEERVVLDYWKTRLG